MTEDTPLWAEDDADDEAADKTSTKGKPADKKPAAKLTAKAPLRALRELSCQKVKGCCKG